MNVRIAEIKFVIKTLEHLVASLSLTGAADDARVTNMQITEDVIFRERSLYGFTTHFTTSLS